MCKFLSAIKTRTGKLYCNPLLDSQQRNETFENKIRLSQIDDKNTLKNYVSLSEYAKDMIRINEYYFFTSNSDEEVEKLNNEFIEYCTNIN